MLHITPYVGGRPIEEIQREFKIKDVIKLASNENALGPSPKAVAALKKALGEIHRYPDGDCYYLRNKLAEKLKLKPENLVFGCGSDEIIVLAVRAFVNSGDEVVIAKPTFLIYEIASALAGAKITFVPLKGFRYDLRAMKSAITPKTKMVFIANPDNPTGTYVNKKEVAEFMRGLPENLLVYFDEAYYELVDKKDFPDSFEYLGKQPLIIARTFSKAYGLSGLRIGYGIAEAKIIDYLNRAREPFNVNSLAQVAALAALDDQAHLKRTRELLKEAKGYLYKSFRQLGIDFIPSVTNFVVMNIGPRSATIYRELLKKGVIVRDMSCWGLNQFLRVTMGTMRENKKFIQALKEALAKEKR
ncbi:MAG: histidinol-phosphate transaminase [Candidatus Omnitrophota bacterium]